MSGPVLVGNESISWLGLAARAPMPIGACEVARGDPCPTTRWGVARQNLEAYHPTQISHPDPYIVLKKPLFEDFIPPPTTVVDRLFRISELFPIDSVLWHGQLYLICPRPTLVFSRNSISCHAWLPNCARVSQHSWTPFNSRKQSLLPSVYKYRLEPPLSRHDTPTASSATLSSANVRPPVADLATCLATTSLRVA